MNLKELFPKYEECKDFSPTVKFTVFTPFFNSEKSLHRVFQSLNNQTFKEFELILINDGSTDNSHEVALKYIEESNFLVNYINNPINKHKMSCLMQAVQLARGEYFLPFDADDECVNDALAIFASEFENVSNPYKETCIAVTALCLDQFGNRVGDRFPSNPFYSNTFRSNNIEDIKGEKWGFTKTKNLKGVKLNEFLYNKGLIPEGLIWNLFAKEGFVTKYINNDLRIYHLNVENSISSSLQNKNALGAVLYNMCNINWFYKQHRFKIPVFFLKCVYFLLLNSVYLEYRFIDYYKAIDSKLFKGILIISWPFRKYF